MGSENHSQVLFGQGDVNVDLTDDDSTSGEVEEIVMEEQDKRDEQNVKKNISQHWLFRTKQQNVFPPHPRENKLRRKVSPKDLEEQMNYYVQKLKKYQKRLPPIETFSIINEEEIEVASVDETEYLFRNDTMRFKKTFNIQNLIKNKPMATIQTNSNTQSTSYNPFTTGRFPRKAKEKKKTVIETSNDSDDEFINEDVTKKKKKQSINQNDNAKTERRTILIEAKPLKKTNQKRTTNNVTNKEPIEIDDGENLQPNKKRKTSFFAEATKKVGNVITNLFKTVNKEEENESNLENYDQGPASQENTECPIASPEKTECPMCYKLFPEKDIERHASSCDGPVSPVANKTRNKTLSQASSSVQRNAFNEIAWQKSCNGITSSTRKKPIPKENDEKENIKLNDNFKESKQDPKKMVFFEKAKNNSNPKKNTENQIKNQENKKWMSDDESDKEDPMKIIKPNLNLRKKSTKNTKQNGIQKKNPIFDNNEDSQDDLLNQYLTKTTKLSHKKKAYTTQNFNDSQNHDQKHEKCVRCNNWFLHGTIYQEHVRECLSHTTSMIDID